MEHTLTRSALLWCAVIASANAAYGEAAGLETPEARAETRCPCAWPFSAESIWNTPIGSEAEYAPAGIGAPGERAMTVDEDVLILEPGAPMTPVRFSDAGWDRSADRCIPTGGLLFEAPIPADFVVSPENWDGLTPNASMAVLMPDGRTLKQAQPFARCEAGGPAAFGLVFAIAAGFSPPAHAEEPPEGMVELELDLPEPSYAGRPVPWIPRPDLPYLSWDPCDPVYVPEGVENVALGRPVSASAEPTHNELAHIVNGEKSYEPEKLVGLPDGPQWIQIDLQSKHEIHVIHFWQYFELDRVYNDVVVQVSNAPEFKEKVTTVFNNDYDNTLGFGEGEDPEFRTTHVGKLVEVDGLEARYVRLWSNGSHWNRRNHWREVEIYAKPMETG